MSAFNPRRSGPNVSQYIASLNAIPSPTDNNSAGQAQDAYGLDDDLALFTNVEFLDTFDLDAGNNGAENGPGFGQPGKDGDVKENESKGLGFEEAYPLNDFSFLPGTATNPVFHPLQAYAHPPAFADGVPAPTSSYIMPLQGAKPSCAESASPAGDTSLEATSRAAAEEDKRRRNTAASARFRVKKKQREQALEKTTKEMTDRADALEARIAELERENGFLRGLVVDKAMGERGEVTELLMTLKSKDGERSLGGSKKGVGTKDDTERVLI